MEGSDHMLASEFRTTGPPGREVFFGARRCQRVRRVQAESRVVSGYDASPFHTPRTGFGHKLPFESRDWVLFKKLPHR